MTACDHMLVPWSHVSGEPPVPPRQREARPGKHFAVPLPPLRRCQDDDSPPISLVMDYSLGGVP